MREALRGLTVTDGYRVLKVVAETLVEAYEGYNLPNGSPEAQQRFANAGIMRKGFNMLFAQVEKQAHKMQREPSFVQQLMTATMNQPREVEVEVENKYAN